MKYIMLNHFRPIIFSETLTHDMFNNLPGTITSAGFVNHVNGRYVCSGRSISLGMNPARDDEENINKFLGENK